MARPNTDLSECPGPDELEQFASCGADDDSRIAIQRHIAVCLECESRLSDISENLRVVEPVRHALFDDRPDLCEPLPESIGRYRILREIGRGGMGRVFEAEQDNPRRRVALKVIRPGCLTPSSLRRLEFESQVLGRLQHPGIAQIFEAGAAGTGNSQQPYFAMEIVRGQSLRRYADSRQLDSRGRLMLIARVCDAVQHAHQKGVIHRDLKPANILVDESGQPKILDFGVARATDSDLQAPTIETTAAQLIGTIPYMSPEQVSGDPDALDTRSDVYALGVVLYELLAGRLPYELNKRNLPEAVRAIREDAPAPLGSVDRALAGDVATIVDRALEKEKDRRYQSAAELAADIRRFLNDEPILARPPSALYQLSKFTRRNKPFVAASAAAVFLLVGGTTVATWQAVRASAAQAHAEDQERTARKEADKFKAVNTFLQDMLAAADPDTIPGDRDVSIRDAMRSAIAKIEEGSLADQPVIEAAVRTTIGNVFRSLGDYPAAEPHLRRAVELGRQQAPNGNEDLAHSLNKLARLLDEKGELDAAEALFREALAMRRRLLGDDHPDVATVLNNLASVLGQKGEYEQAERLHRRALAMRRDAFGDEHTDVANSLNNLAVLYWNNGQPEKAEPLLRESLEIDRRLRGDDSHVITTLANLGTLLSGLGRLDDAERMLHDALEMRRRLVGDEHPEVATGLNNLALLLKRKGDYEAAESMFREALAMDRKLRGARHARVANTMSNLASTLTSLDRLDEAEAIYTEAISISVDALGEAHASTLSYQFQLATLYSARDEHEKAESLLATVVSRAKDALPPDHWFTGAFLSAHGSCLTKLQRFAEAETALLKSHGILTRSRGADFDRTKRTAEALAELYEAWHVAQPNVGHDTKAAEWRAEPAPHLESSDSQRYADPSH